MSFYDDVIKQSFYFNSPSLVHDMNMLEPNTRAAVQAILAEAAAAGEPLLVFETYRSVQRQEELFKRGATQLSEVGVHHYGLGADLVKSVNGSPSWKGSFAFMSALAKKHGLVSGVDWGHPEVKHLFYDGAHVQRISVKDQDRLFAGEFYPDHSYDPFVVTI